MFKRTIATIAGLILGLGPVAAQQATPERVRTLSPPGAIKPTGTWGLATRAGDFIFVAGMRGIDPRTDTLVAGDEARVRQAFLNMKLIAESEGVTLKDAVRLVVFVTDMFRYRPLINMVQAELLIHIDNPNVATANPSTIRLGLTPTSATTCSAMRR